MKYLVARTMNGRPSLQHAIHPELGVNYSWCGIDVYGWSRAYSPHPIEQILCIRCARKIAAQTVPRLRMVK